MKSGKINKVMIIALPLFICTGFCVPATAADDTVLDTVPGDILFCARINNFYYTLGQLDGFLSGISPLGVSMMARMQLARMLGDPALQGLDMAGSFVIFGKSQAGSSAGGASQSMVIAALLPVKNYDEFLDSSPNIGDAGADGMSLITVPPMMPMNPNAPPPAATLLCAKAGSFALIGPADKREQLAALAKSIGTAPLSKKIEAGQAKLSAETPVWLYADIEQVNIAFADEIKKAFAEIEKQMNTNPGMSKKNLGGVMKVYSDLIKSLLQDGKFVSVTLQPEPAVLRVKKTFAAKAGTELAALLQADKTLPAENKLVAQLEGGSVFTAATKVNRKDIEKLNEIGIAFIKAMYASGPNSAEILAEWEKLANESPDVLGNLFAISMKPSPDTKPPFAADYIIQVKDKEKFDEIIDEYLKLSKSPAVAEMYKPMGMEMSYEMTRGTGEYLGVSIDSAKLTMKATDPNSPQAQAIKKIYGEGLDYRFAYVGDLELLSLGGGCEENIKKMIESVKTGSNKTPDAEISSALSMLEGYEKADCLGTANIIRLLSIFGSFAPMNLPFNQIPTKSNIVFAGRRADGKLTFDIAVPKDHIMEISTGMQMIMMQQQQQRMQQMQQGEQPVN